MNKILQIIKIYRFYKLYKLYKLFLQNQNWTFKKCPILIFKKESLQKKILKNHYFFYEAISKLRITAWSWLYLKKVPDCIRKTWKNLGKSEKIWENLEKSEKYAKKIGQNRTK